MWNGTDGEGRLRPALPRPAGRTWKNWWRNQNGMATAEFALVLPAVVMVLAAVLLAASAGVSQVRVTETAREVARAISAGDSFPHGQPGVSVHQSGSNVEVTVSRPLPALLGWAGMQAEATLVIPKEPVWEE